jgi:2-dehydropantoate 2-reductase
MKILMVGCGAVGQVLGYYLQKAGVELAFFARDETEQRLKQALEEGGLLLYQIPLTRRQRPFAQCLNGYQVITDLAGSQQFNPDQIWFSTPSTVYYSTWYQKFLRDVPCERVVCFPPEGRRTEFILPGSDEERFVFGGITFIAWQGDLNGGGGKPDGVNYLLPPLAEIPLMGVGIAPGEVAGTLKEAGLRAGMKNEKYKEMQAAVTALMSAFVVGFEIAGWSFGAYRRSPWIKLASQGAQQAVFTQLSEVGVIIRGFFGIITTPVLFNLAAIFLPLLTPFDLEKYIQFHYRKTREQTLHLLNLFIKDGEEQGMAVGSIQVLRQGLIDSK